MALSKETIFAKKCWFFWKKKAHLSKIKGVLVLKYIVSETKYVCILTDQI